MNFYFSSPVNSALKIDGELMPPLAWDKPLELNPCLSPFIEYLPLNSPYNLHFFLDENLLNNPPNTIEICDLKGGYNVCFIPPEQTMPFKVVTQKKTDACFTIFCQNGYALSVETANDFFTTNLSPANRYEIVQFYLDGKNLTAVIITTNKKQILVFDTSTGKINLLTNQTVNEIDLNGGLTLIKKYFDIAKHSVTTNYGYQNGELYIKNKDIKSHPAFDKFNIGDRLIPYVFLEEFLVGGDYDFYLCEEVKVNKDKLFGYFGEYLGVIPPPRFRPQNEVGIIKRKSENHYFIDYFSFDVKDGKILNLFKK